MPTVEATAPQPGYAAENARSKTILSVSTMPYQKTFRMGPGFVTLYIPPAKIDEWKTLKVFDTYERIMDRSQADDEHPHGIPSPAPIKATQLAQDIMNDIGGGTLGAKLGVRPGVLLCDGEEPTKEEIEQAFATHRTYCRRMVEQAHEHFSKGELKEITAEFRRCAEYLKLSPPWITPLDVTGKPCPACGEQILTQALKCKHCQTFLPDFYVATGLDASGDAVVRAAIAAKAKPVVQHEAPPIPPTPGQPINPPTRK